MSDFSQMEKDVKRYADTLTRFFATEGKEAVAVLGKAVDAAEAGCRVDFVLGLGSDNVPTCYVCSTAEDGVTEVLGALAPCPPLWELSGDLDAIIGS